MKKALFATTLFLAALNANAAIVSADFRNESDLPYCCARSGPEVLESIGQAVGAGVELNGTASFSNPSGWGGGIVYVDLNPTTNILTLLSQDTWDFQTFSAQLSNIAFSASETITGLTLLSNNLTTTGLTPSLSFTGNSISIEYDTPSVFNFTGGTATFQILTSSLQSVPEPSSIALLGLSLFGLASMRRKP